jgi:hypothetical protein
MGTVPPHCPIRTAVRIVGLVTDLPRLTRPDVEFFRRSVAGCGALPRDQLDRLLDEVARLLDEREAVAGLVAELASPWRDVRAVLNEIYLVLNVDRANRDTPD